MDDGMDIVDDGEGTGTGDGDALAMQPHQQDFSRPPGIEYWNWGMVERLRRKLSALIADATTDEHQQRKLRHMRESIGVVETKLDPQPASGPITITGLDGQQVRRCARSASATGGRAISAAGWARRRRWAPAATRCSVPTRRTTSTTISTGVFWVLGTPNYKVVATCIPGISAKCAVLPALPWGGKTQ